jgi:phosphatidylserine/phosphatidylglycerophosphate/cardiolipin synthase-like enzyme
VPAVEIDTLDPAPDGAGKVADRLATWISEARRSLDVAIYDFEARAGASARVATALEGAAGRGVRVRVAFNVMRIRHAAAPRPPRSRPETIDGLEVPTRGVTGDNSLMHHKYVVRDGRDVWTGSLNWTDDAFSLEENLVLRMSSREVAAAFTDDFEALWSHGSVEASGLAGPEVTVEDVVVQPFFSPKGPSLAQTAASRIARAGNHLRLLSPVMTAGAILGTVAEIAPHQGFDLVGAYDLTQMHEVQAQWAEQPQNRWKIDAWRIIAERLSGKRSTPYREDAVHDYMHAKAIVADGTVVAGSYNLSKHGVRNAENLVIVRGGRISEPVLEFADRVAARYAAVSGSSPAAAAHPAPTAAARGPALGPGPR